MSNPYEEIDKKFGYTPQEQQTNNANPYQEYDDYVANTKKLNATDPFRALRPGGSLYTARSQLGKTEYSDWENDTWQRARLGMERARTQKALDDYKGGGDGYDEFAHQRLQGYMDYLNQMEGGYQNRQEYFGQFGSEDNYNAYMDIEPSWERAQQRGLTRRQWHEEVNAQAENAYTEIEVLEDIEIPRLQREINRAESGMQADGNRYDDYMDATREAEALKQELQDAQARLDAAYENARKYGYQRQFTASLQFSDLPEMEGWEEGLEERRAEAEAASAQAQEERRQDINLGDLFDAPEASYYEFPQADWTQEEKDIFAWYYHNDPETAKKIAAELNAQHRAGKWSETQGEVYQYGHDNLAVSAPLGTVGRILTSPLGLIDWFGQTIDYMASGYEMPRDTFSPRDYANTLSAGAAAGLNDKFGTLPEDWAIIGGKGWGDAYQLANSIGESMAWGALSKGLTAAGAPEWLGATVTNMGFFGNAAAETTQDALLRGASSEEALWLGITAGAAEAIGETVSIEHLIHITDAGTMRRLLWNALKQGGIEASEEAFTTLINTVADAWIMGDKSEFNEKVRQNILAGMTREEAEKAAWQDWAEGIAQDALGGFLSGGVSGGVYGSANMIQGSRTEYSGTDRQALLDAALQMDPNGKAYQLAQKIQQQGTMSYNEALQLKDLMGERAELVSREVSDRERADIQQRAETALRASGVENPGAAAQLIAKEVMGEKLSREERRVLKGVQQAGQVSQTLQEQVRQETNFRRYQAQLMRQDVKKQNAAKKKGADTRTTSVKGEKGAVKIEELSTGEKGQTMAKITDSKGESRTVALNDLELDSYQRRALSTFRQVLGRDAIAAYNSLGSENIYSMSAYDIMQQAIAWGNIRNMFGAKTTDAAKSLQAALASPLRGKLSDAQVEQAFEIGRKHAKEEKTERPKSKRGTGHVSLDGGTVDGVELKGIQNKDQVKRSKEYRAVKAIAKALGIDVVLFESEAANEAGDLKGIQGAYQDGVIYLDWNAGMKNLKQVGSRMLLRTMSHELTHFIQQNAPELYEELKDYVTGYLADKMGADFNDLVAQKMAGRNVNRDGAIDEVVADACETMLRDSQAVKDLVQNHRSLWQSIKDFVLKYLGNITAEDTGAIYMQDAIQNLQEIWGRGLKAAVENRTDVETGVGEMVNEKGQTVATVSEETGGMQLSIRTYNEGGKQALRSFLNQQVEKGALTKKEAQEIRSQVETLYQVCRDYDNGKYAPFSAWSNASVVTYDGRPVFSVVKANGEYKLNLDFSLVCKKRRTLDAVFNEMISLGIMDDFDMVQESIAKINDIIRENGFETACGLCFVDSKRYRQGMIADAFVGMYNMQVMSLVKSGSGQKVDYFNYGGDQTKQNTGHGIDTLPDDQLDWTKIDKILQAEKKTTVRWKIADYLKNNPSARRRVMRGDFMSTAGFDAVKAQNPQLLSLYNSKKGAGGPKAAQSDVQYLNEIINQNMFNEKSAYEVGGVRIQSFSDYVGRLVFDYVQMVADLSAKKLPAHSYTKEFMFAQQFGLTGIKINMSLVPEVIKGGVAAGLDADGNYAWKDGQSFGSTVYDNKGKRLTAAEGFELAKRIQNADGYSKNCGTIAVGVSDEHIRKMLDDPEIRMIIPYHKSSLNHIVAAMMNIDQYTDYTLQQNTRERKGGKWVNIPKGQEFNFNEALQRLGDAKAAANEYLAWCRENGYRAKFDQFADNPNYYKVLEDFSCYDKDGVTNTPLSAVQMKFPGEGDAFGSMSELIEQGLEEDAILQAKQEQAVPEIVKQIQAVLPEFEGTVRERNAKKGSKKAATTGGETAQLSSRGTGEFFTKDKYYDRQIDQWETKQDGARIKVGDLKPGSALNKVGFPSAGMWFDVGKIKKGFDAHSDHYSKDILKSVPALLNDPIAITEFRGNKGDIDNTVTVYGLTIPKTNIPVVVGVMMTKGRDGKMIVNKIRTVHADSHADINDNNILYLNENKKRTRDWFQVCGITVPLEGTTFGLIRSITYKEKESNRKAQLSARNLTSKEAIDAEIDRLQSEIANSFFEEDEMRNNPEYRAAYNQAYRAESYKEKVEGRRALNAVKKKLGFEVFAERRTAAAEEIKRLKGMRKKFLSVSEISESDYGKLKRHFGTTEDWDVAGFILKDGIALDFSGKKQYGRNYTGGREILHNEVGDVIGMPKDTSPRINMLNNGNIRLAPEIGGINLAAMPTAKQFAALRDYIDHNNGAVKVDIDDIGGDTVESFSYYNGTSSSKVISDIRNYFNTGSTPAQASDLRAFLSVRSNNKTDRELLAGVTAQTVMSERLQQENEILRESVRDLRKLLGQRDSALDKLRRQLRLTKSPELRLNDAKRMTRSLLQDYDSRADAARIAQEVKELGEFILGTELTGEAYDQEFDRRLGSIARQVVENAKAEFTEGTDVYKEIASRIKGKKISVDAGNLGDLGDFGAFRKSLFGKLIVAQRAANTQESRADYTSADQLYAELQADYGETIFPTALNEGEELQNIARALENAKPTEANPFAQDMQAAEESVRNRVLMDLYSGALELEAPTAADRAKSRRKALQDQIKQLQRENRLSEKESQRMAEQIYALDTALDKARSQYETLLRENEERRNELEKYRKQLDRYEQKEREVSQALNDLDALVKEGTDADAVNKQRARLSDKERQMTEALKQLSQLQERPALQQILQRERAIERTRTRERIREGVNRRDLRQRVEKLWKDMNRRITSPTEKKHIPVPVMQQAIEVLQALNMDTSREGTKSGEKLRSKLTELKARYEALQKDPDYRQAAMYDEQVAEYLTNMIEQVGDTPINKMSVAQLETVYRTLTALDHVARHALKLKLGEEERSAYEVSQAMTRETRSVPKAKTGLAAAWLNAQLSAERMFRRLGGYHKNSTWEQVYRMLNDGQLRQTQIQMEGSMIFADLLAAKEYGKFVDPGSTVDIGLTDEDGNPVKITHGMLVSLWMHLQNEQNRRHVAFGGLTIPGLKDYYNGKKVKGSERAIRIGGALQELAEINDRLQALEESDSASADEIAELEAQRDEVSVKAIEYVESLQESIEKQLTDYDRQWIAACRELFDGLSKRVLNQTTLEVYGIKRATVENYFPIWVDGDFLNTPFETVARDLSLENAGFMKERVDSSKPIRLADVSDVAASQIRKVSQYAGLMPAIRNFGKVWGKTQTGYRDSLRKAVHETFGQNGVNYIEHLMADLNGARGQDTGALGEFFNRMRGRMAQASLTMNLRVALGQTASYPTAAAVVGWKALHKALWRGGRNNWALSPADQEMIRKWSPLLYYRMQGYRDTELGDIAGMNSKFDRVWKKARWLTGWIQAMDGATVGRLWYAAEYYVQDHNKDLQKGTDAYYEAVAKVFNDIVERTQPNYSTMQRPDILRNPNALVKQLTMFMTQRLQNFNILYDAAATYSTMRADYKAKRNGVTLEDVRQAARDTRRAAVSQVAAGATIVLFKALAAALMHKVNPFRDDDKELTPESVSMTLLDMFMDSMAGNVLFGTEVWDFAESKIFGTTYYGIELSGVGVVTDLIDAASTLFDHAVKGELSWKDADLLAKRLGSVAGIPYSNAKDIVMGGVHWVQDGIAGELFSFEAGVDRTTAMQAHRLYRAYQDKDFGKANKIRAQVPEDKQKDLDEAVRTYIKEQYKAGDITVYEAMRQLQSYGNASTDMMRNFIQEQYADGNLPKGDAIKYLQEYCGKDQAGAEETVRNWTAKRDTGTSYDDIHETFAAGGLTADEARDMLVNYGGMSRDEAQDRVDYWAYKDRGGVLSEKRFKTFRNDVAPTGVSLDYYDRALQEINADGNSSYSQAEAGPYLKAEEAAGHLTHAQAAAIWDAITTGKASYDDWLAKNK